MSKRVLTAHMKRTLAFLLTAVMVFSTVDSASLSAYATGEGNAVVTEEVEKTTEGDMYTGDVWTSTNVDTGYENLYLDIIPENADADKTEFSAEEIATILSNYETGSFDRILISSTDIEDKMIYKDVINSIIPYLKTNDDAGQKICFRFNNSESGSYTEWYIYKPQTQISDFKVGFDISIVNGSAYVTTSGQGIDSESVELVHYLNKSNETTLADSIVDLWGDSDTRWLTVVDTNATFKYYGLYSNDQYLRMSIDDINLLEADKSYQTIYNGKVTTTIHNDGYEYKSLSFLPSQMGKDSFTVDELINMISTREEAAYDEIRVDIPLDYKNGQNLLSKNLIDSFLPYLKPKTEDRDNRIYLRYYGNNGTSKRWYLYNAGVQEADQYVDVTFSFDKAEDGTIESMKFCPKAEYDINAEEVWFSAIYGVNDENLSDIYNDTKTYLKEGSNTLDVVGTNNTVNCYVDSFYISYSTQTLIDFTYNTTYTLEIPSYKGTVSEEEGLSVLRIDASEMENNAIEVSDTNIISILEARPDKFNIVELNMSGASESISKELWNAAVSVLTTEEGAYTAIRYNQSGEDVDMNWNFEKVENAEDAIPIGVTYAIGAEGEGISFNFANTSIPADSCFNIYSDENRNVYSSMIAALGEEGNLKIFAGDTALNNVDVNKDDITFTEEDIEKKGINISVVPVHNLTANTDYVVKTAAYIGDLEEYEDGWISLYIRSHEAGVDAFTEEELNAILDNYSKADGICEIFFDQTETDTNIIYKSVVNKAANLFDSDYGHIGFWFYDDKNQRVEWTINGEPSELLQTEDQTLNAEVYTSENNEELVLVVGEQALAASDVTLSFLFSRENIDETFDEYLISLFGEEKCNIKTSGDEVEGEYDIDDNFVYLRIYQPGSLLPDKEYSVIKNEYKGHINEWDDGTKELWIGFEQAMVERLSEDDLNAILDNYSTEDGIGAVYIQQPRLETNTIYKSVANKAVTLITKEYGQITFAFRDTNTEQCVEWQLSGSTSQMVQVEDQNVNAGIYISEANEEHGDELVLSVAEQSLVAENVNVNFFISRKNVKETADEYIIGLFGEEDIQLETAGGEVDGWYSVNEWDVGMGFHNPGALTPDKGYSIIKKDIKKEYRGDVWENTDVEGNVLGTTLHLDSDMVNLDTWTPEAFNKAIQYWINKGITFDSLHIEQKYTANNVIKKEVLNAAIPLLSNPDEQMIEFAFCQCEMEELDDEGNVTQEYSQCEYIWALQGPKTATKDINANATFKNKKGAGISVVLPENTYASEHTHIQFWMDNKASMFEDVLVPVFGYPVNSEESFEAGQLVVLEKGTSLKFEDKVRYDGDGQYVNLYISNIEEWTTKVDNRLIRPIPYGSLAAVGNTFALPIFGNFNPNNPNEDYTPAKGGKFTVLTPDVATLEGDKFTATVPDRTAYTLYSYTSVKNETCLEVLRISTIAEIFGLSFVEDTREEVWDSNNSQEGYLEVKVSPASIQNRINPQDYDWEIVSGNSIVLKETEYETYYDEETGEDVTIYRKNGEFSVVGYGETVVKVSYGDCSATCTVNVKTPVMVPELPAITAIPAVDVTLADVDVDALIKEMSDNTFEGTFVWQDSTTKLAPFADNGWHTFGATYTVEGREPVPVTICVDMLKIENIEIWDMEKDENDNFVLDEPGITSNSISVGDEIVYGFQVNANRMDGTNIYGDGVLQRYVENGDILFKWTDKESLNLLDAEHKLNDIIGLARSYTADKKGKKTFKIAAVNAKTNKVIASNSVTVLVTEKDLFSFDYDVFTFGDDVDPGNKMKGTYTISVDSRNYANAKKLTIKSGDTSVLKLGRVSVKDANETTSGLVEITIPYEFKKYGETVLKITASDETKTSKVIPVERVDYEPRPSLDSYTIDKSWTIGGEYKPETILNIAFQHDTLPTTMVTIKETEYRDLFILDGSVEEAWYEIKLADADVDNGTYKLTLQIPYSIDGEEQTPVEKVIKVKVQESKVNVKVKQTKKINEFYDLAVTSEGEGVLTIDAGKAQVIDAWISNEDSVFKLTRIGINEFTIGLKDGIDLAGEKLTAEQKKVQVTYSVVAENGALHENTVNVSVKTENKAPQLVLSLKNETLYPSTGQEDATVQILDKKTKNPVNVSGCISLVDKKSGMITDIVTAGDFEESTPYEYITIGKNQYYIQCDYNEIYYYLYDVQNAVKATDKAVLRVQNEGWNGYVDLNYAIKVDLSVPKVVLDNKVLTLNANNELYQYQIAKTPIKIKNHSDFPYVEEGWVTGANAKSNAALKNNLNICVMDDLLVAKIVDKGTGDTILKDGSYKFKVWTVINGQKYNTDLTVKIVDKAPEKVVKVTKKGSIDVLRRGSTQITLSPTFNNVSGELRDFWLEGPDADMFDAYIDEHGDCVVKAKDNYEAEYGNSVVFNYSTRHNYQIRPVYAMEDRMVGSYALKGSLQKIKVTQGKPKVIVDCSTNALYGDKSYGALFTFDTMLKDEHIAIESVELLNYTEDLIWDSENNILQVNTDADPVEITKASGKYTIKFAISYRDAAGNEKATQVSYKLNIVR